MKRRTVTLILVLVATRSYAQRELAPPAQELEPARSALTYHSPEYPVRIREVLFKKAQWRNEFQFLSMPSFLPETLLTVRSSGDEYIAQVLRPEKRIGSYKGDEAELRVIEKEKRLPKLLAERARGLWQTMLLRTKFQRRRRVLDGVSYTFLGSPPGYSRLTARSSNPVPGTKPNLLARIGSLLIAYVASDPAQTKDLEAQLEETMKQLEHALRTGDSSNKRIEHESGKAAADVGLTGAVHP